MSINDNLNSPTTFLRSQSYIVNGKPNPLSNISRKKYFSNFISKYKRQNNSKQPKKISYKNNNYIKEIKKRKKKMPSSINKFNNNIKKEIKNKKQEDDVENINEKKYYQSSGFSLNINGKQKVNEKVKKQKTINFNINKDKEYNERNIIKNKIDYINLHKKKKDFCNNAFKGKKIKFQIYKSNEFNYTNNDSYKYNLCITNENIKNCNYDDISNMINNFYIQKLSEKKTKHNLLSNYNDYEKLNNDSLTKSEKIKKKKKIINTIKKEDIFLNKILSSNEEDYINRKSNNLLNKLNNYKRRENYTQGNNYIEKNNTKEVLKLLKKSINKMPSFNLNLEADKNNYKIAKINEISKNKNNNLNTSIKNKIKCMNHPYYCLSNNDYSPDLLKSDKDVFSRSLSNAIYAMRDERNTNKFIKELNNNNNYNSNKKIKFSFSKERFEELNDKFYSPLEKKINLFKLENKQYTNYKNNNIIKKINYIKKNSSLYNFRRNSKTEYFQSNIQINNNKLRTCMNLINNTQIMPAN